MLLKKMNDKRKQTFMIAQVTFVKKLMSTSQSKFKPDINLTPA